jgi:hypothetical protein
MTKDPGRALSGRRSSAVGRASRSPHDVLMTAVRRYESGRAHRHRAVYVAVAFRDNAVDDSYPVRRDTRRTMVVALSRHDPYSPLAGTLLRPFGDAAVAIQSMLRR